MSVEFCKVSKKGIGTSLLRCDPWEGNIGNRENKKTLIFAAVKAEWFFSLFISISACFYPKASLQEQAERGGSGGLQDTPSCEQPSRSYSEDFFPYIFPDQ